MLFLLSGFVTVELFALLVTMRMHSVKVVVASIVILLLSLSLICDGYPHYFDLYVEGSECDDNGHICKRMPQCEPASEEYNKTGRTHSFPRCGFVGDVELVCCPPYTRTRLVEKRPNPPVAVLTAINVDTTGTAKRKCVRACEEITKFANRQVNTNILDGDDASLGEFPHMAALGTPDNDANATLNWRCGASIISDRYVLTAGHCIIDVSQVTPTMVRIGRVNIDDPNGGDAQEFGIINITVHPQFNRRLKVNDIAVVELDNPIKRSVNVHPACLYTNNDDPRGLVASGWGVTSLQATTGSKILQKANLVAVPVSECNETFSRLKILDNLSNQHFCTRSPPGRTSDTCLGDSGGPLQVENVQDSKVFSIVGITSTGNGCGGNTPGVYTRVSNYLDWIEGIVWPNL